MTRYLKNYIRLKWGKLPDLVLEALPSFALAFAFVFALILDGLEAFPREVAGFEVVCLVEFDALDGSPPSNCVGALCARELEDLCCSMEVDG